MSLEREKPEELKPGPKGPMDLEVKPEVPEAETEEGKEASKKKSWLERLLDWLGEPVGKNPPSGPSPWSRY